MAEEMNRLKVVVAGGSNAAKVAAECKGPGITVESIAAPGWRLASNTVRKLIDSIAILEENVVVVLYGIDNICFVSVDEDMRSGPPYRGKDGKFHAHGTLEVVSGVLFDRILTLLKDVVSACKGRKLILILPFPRYWIPCCEKGRKLDSLESDSEKRRLLKDLGRLRSAISGMVARLHATGWVDIIVPRAPEKEDLNARELLRRADSAGPVSPTCLMYKAESWQRAVTLDNSTPQCRISELRVWSYEPFIAFASSSSG